VIRPTIATVHLDAVRGNVAALRAMLAGEAQRAGRRPAGIIAVVKANAYGHGAVQVGVALEAAGVSMLACADIAEGVMLRQAGVTVPILIFGALSVSDVSGLFEYGLTPTVSTPGSTAT
jgi:alanine racemase